MSTDVFITAERNKARWGLIAQEMRDYTILEKGLIGTISPREVLSIGCELIEHEFRTVDLMIGDPYPDYLTKVIQDMVAAAYEIGQGLEAYELLSKVRRTFRQCGALSS